MWNSKKGLSAPLHVRILAGFVDYFTLRWRYERNSMEFCITLVLFWRLDWHQLFCLWLQLSSSCSVQDVRVNSGIWKLCLNDTSSFMCYTSSVENLGAHPAQVIYVASLGKEICKQIYPLLIFTHWRVDKKRPCISVAKMSDAFDYL